MHQLMKSLAVAVVCVCSVLAQLPKESKDLKLGKVFGATGEIFSDIREYDSLLQPVAFWVIGSIKVDTFGHMDRFYNEVLPPQSQGYTPDLRKLTYLKEGQDVTSVVCGFDGGGMIYLELTITGPNGPRRVSAGTPPTPPTDDMIDHAPPGMKLSGFVTFQKDGNIVGTRMIWTTRSNGIK